MSKSHFGEWDDENEEDVQMEKFAIAAMEELEKNGQAEFLLLKNDPLRKWWQEHKAHQAKLLAAKLERERRARIKEEALAKLSTEEREILGLNKNSTAKVDIWDEVVDEDGFSEWGERDSEMTTINGSTYKVYKVK